MTVAAHACESGAAHLLAARWLHPFIRPVSCADHGHRSCANAIIIVMLHGSAVTIETPTKYGTRAMAAQR